MTATNNGNAPSADGKRPLRDGIDTVKGQIGDVAQSTVEQARSIAGGGLHGGVEGSPLLTLAGGIAVGVLVGALLPRSDRETALLGSVGARLIDAAREAADAARDAGRDKLDEAGLSRDGARDAVRGVLDAALAAAFSAGNAAAETAKHKVAEARD